MKLMHYYTFAQNKVSFGVTRKKSIWISWKLQILPNLGSRGDCTKNAQSYANVYYKNCNWPAESSTAMKLSHLQKALYFSDLASLVEMVCMLAIGNHETDVQKVWFIVPVIRKQQKRELRLYTKNLLLAQYHFLQSHKMLII